MNYKDTLAYMYSLLPMYQRVGKIAFKKDLTNTLKLCEVLGNPQDTFKSIHIAGTNGKGSSAHMIASILQSAGYKTGLYTSPHLKSFTERIKIDGQEIDEQFVSDLIEKVKTDIKEIQPSFFELTVAMAFECFSGQKVDVAVIEVGLGGRFDSTNVISPIVSLITSIGLDHTDMLGETLPEIAFEKAGIIKKNVDVVISETQHEISNVFKNKANEMDAAIYFADQEFDISVTQNSNTNLEFTAKSCTNSFSATTDLAGEYQIKNIPGVMKVLDLLNAQGFHISNEQTQKGFSDVIKNTGLLGRWHKLADNPLTICDTVHNELGIKHLIGQIEKMSYDKLYIIWGAVEGKNLLGVFQYLPRDAFYYFCEASIPRALKASVLQNEASKFGLAGGIEKDVNTAIAKARQRAGPNDLVFIGGSNFLIAEIKDLN